jgi:type IV pilus assembly protein PilC
LGEFKFKAKDARGKAVEGTLNGNDKKEINRQLRQLKLRPIFIKEQKDDFFSNLFAKDAKGNIILQLGSGMPSIKELSIFTKQFSIMIERGVPLIQALGILAGQQKSPRFARVIERIKAMVENGATLSAAMGNFPKVFDDLFISMIRAGEASGNLDVVLQETVKFLEKSAKLKAQLKSASVYPMILLTVAMGITYGILVFLVPVFAEQYSSNGNKLPALTEMVIQISNALQAYMLHLIGVIAVAVFAFKKYKSTPKGQEQIDRISLKLPLVGDVIRKVAIGRFTATLATMLSSGVSILDALTICAQSAGNKTIEAFIRNVQGRISQGSTFAQPLSEGDLFPGMVVSMVTVGEQTGALDQTLQKVGELYEEEVDAAVATLTASIQPILIVGIGAVLGVVIIALYLPILDSANQTGG